MELFIQSLPAFGILALVFVFFKNNWVSKQEVGNEKMARIAKNIADGAMSFLKAEYKILSIFVAAVAVLLFFKGQQVGNDVFYLLGGKDSLALKLFGNPA